MPETKKTQTVGAALVTPKPNRKARKAARKAKAPKAAAPEPKAKAPKAKVDPEDRERAHAQVRELVAKESARRRCLCGCGVETPKSFFVPGHDAKLMSSILRASRGEDEAKAA